MLKTFYINLDTSQQRNARMVDQLQALGLPFERIAAVNGAALSQQQKSLVDEEKFLLNTKRHIKDGEIGCAISHRLIWQRMLDDNIAYALILEDDVTIDKAILSVLQVATTSQVFDFLNLSSNFPYNITTDNVKALLAGHKTVTRAAKNHHDFVPLDWSKHWQIFALHQLNASVVACECNPVPALASGYLISKKAASCFLAASDVLTVPIDNIWRYAGGALRQGFLVNPLIVQTQQDTHIGDRTQTISLSWMQKVQRAWLKRQPNPRLADVKRMYYVK